MTTGSSDLIAQAKRWSEDSNFKLINIEDSDKRLNFQSEFASFYVYIPEGVTDRWNVWSKDDACVALLSVSEVQEYFATASRSIIEILTKTETLLSKRHYQSQMSSGTASTTSQEEDEDDDYYQDEDNDIDLGDDTIEMKAKDISLETADDFFTGDGSPAAVHRLLTDLKAMQKANKYGIHGQPKNDNLFLWDVELTDFDMTSTLGKDLSRYSTAHSRKPVVQLEMKFPKDYPMNPPFVRVIRPRFKFLTGHITIGGSICMQMLTRSGWSPSNDIESILIQVRAEIMSDGNARLDSQPDREYSEFEAKDAFERMVRRYGWNK